MFGVKLFNIKWLALALCAEQYLSYTTVILNPCSAFTPPLLFVQATSLSIISSVKNSLSSFKRIVSIDGV